MPCYPTCPPSGLFQLSQFGQMAGSAMVDGVSDGSNLLTLLQGFSIIGQIPQKPVDSSLGGTQTVLDFPVTWSLGMTMYNAPEFPTPCCGPRTVLFDMTDSGGGEGQAFGSYSPDGSLFWTDHFTFALTNPEPSPFVLTLTGLLIAIALLRYRPEQCSPLSPNDRLSRWKRPTPC
jgi:hypothetical protein